MNLKFYIIIFLAGCAGVIPGIRFKNKWILIPSITAAAVSAILIIATLLLISGIK